MRNIYRSDQSKWSLTHVSVKNREISSVFSEIRTFPIQKKTKIWKIIDANPFLAVSK